MSKDNFLTAKEWVAQAKKDGMDKFVLKKVANLRAHNVVKSKKIGAIVYYDYNLKVAREIYARMLKWWGNQNNIDSLSERAKVEGRRDTNKMIKETKKFLSVKEYCKETGLKMDKVYDRIERGLLKTKEIEGEAMIPFRSKTEALNDFQVANEKQKIIIAQENKDLQDATKELELTANDIEIGEMLSTKQWADIAGMNYQGLVRALGEAVFAETEEQMEIEMTGGDGRRRIYHLAWPGLYRAQKIGAIIKGRGRMVSTKQHMLKKLFKTPLPESQRKPEPKPELDEVPNAEPVEAKSNLELEERVHELEEQMLSMNRRFDSLKSLIKKKLEAQRPKDEWADV